jgi:signal transduction histidine kinase
MFEKCRFSSKMLLNLINDMMDLAKSEKMKFELNNQLFDLQKTVQRSFETMSYLAFEKNVDLRLKIDEKLYPFIININEDEGRYT